MVQLTEMQEKILTALRREANAAVRIAKVGPDVIQVTVGDERWFGLQAVNAVMKLMVQGLLTRTVGQRYELTQEGTRVARHLPGGDLTKQPVAPARPSSTCPRCRKRLTPGSVRCAACGSRITRVPSVGV